MGESILKLQQIRKSFDHTEVLKGVDLEVAQGEFITLLGAPDAARPPHSGSLRDWSCRIPEV